MILDQEESHRLTPVTGRSLFIVPEAIVGKDLSQKRGHMGFGSEVRQQQPLEGWFNFTM